MNIFRRIFGRQLDTDEELNAATEKHKRATLDLKSAQVRQLEEAEYVRQVLAGVISRIEEGQSHGNNL